MIETAGGLMVKMGNSCLKQEVMDPRNNRSKWTFL